MSYSPSRHLLPEKVQVAKVDAASATDCSHIILDFDLHKDRDLFFDEGVLSTLCNVLPGIQTISFDDLFLTFRFDQLPPKPWPKTVAGMPIYLTVEKYDSGPLDKIVKNRVRTKIRILEEVDARGQAVGDNVEVFDQHVEGIFKYFEKTNIKITQIQNWNDFVVVVLKDKGQNTENLPNHIMRMPCYMLFDEDIRPKRELALRLKEPTLTSPPVSDDAEYQVLRPGVMATCEPLSKGESYTATSGVLVQDCSGNKYVTVASHGFPNLGPVHHPKSDGRIIGNISIDYSSNFNIALMKLEVNESFVNKTFDSAEGSGRRLASLAPTRKTKRGDFVFMNNPFKGMCDGQVGATIYHPHELIKGDSKQSWVSVGIWIWTGKDSSQVMADGICGSPIWNEHDDVIGFFRYVGTGALDGFSYCTGAENLLREGYEICQEY